MEAFIHFLCPLEIGSDTESYMLLYLTFCGSDSHLCVCSKPFAGFAPTAAQQVKIKMSFELDF